MADITPTTQHPNPIHHPPHFFRHAAVRVTQHSLGQVQRCQQVLPAPVRIQALHILTYALQLEEQWPLARDLLLLLSDKLEQSGQREAWLPLLERGLQVSHRHHDIKAMAEIHWRIGYLLQVSGQFAAACTHYAASATAFRQLNQPERCARVLNRYAYTARQQQDRTQALHLVAEALHLVPADHPERANAYLVRGWLAFDERHWQEACDYFRKAVVILTHHGTAYQLACALRDLAGALHLLEQNDEAITTYQQAMTLFAQLGNQFQQAVITMNIGVICLVCHQAARALEHFGQAEPIFHQLYDREHLSQLYLNQGIAQRMCGRLPQSARLLQAAIELFEQIGNLQWLANAVDEFGLTLLQLGETNQAITTFQEALTILAVAPEPSTYQRSEITQHLQMALRTLASS